ncbi:MAG: putative quinol monooxygenase [Paracoccaceae bacterium]
MFIAHVSFCVSKEDRAFALNTLLDQVEAVRSMPGCIAFVPFLDPTDMESVRVLHEWKSQKDMERYTGSQSFAVVGQALRPIMLSPPISKRFDAELIETVN